ncbi:MAG TPA: TlpA disulfide reductase family protein [Solirubrobacteraceae bacterium]|jgi:peroxiredoxin
MSVVFVMSLAALWALVLFQTFVSLGLVRIVRAAADEGGLAAEESRLQDQPAPAFTAEDLHGRPISNEDLAGRPAALLFVSPDCSTCGVTLAELEALRSKVDGAVVVICRSEREQCVQLAQTYGLEVPVIPDTGFALSRLFHIAGAPTAVLLRADGTIETFGRPMSPADLEETVLRAGWHDQSKEFDTMINVTHSEVTP